MRNPHKAPHAIPTVARMVGGLALLASILPLTIDSAGAGAATASAPPKGPAVISVSPTQEIEAAMTRIQNACFGAYPASLIETMSGKKGPVPDEIRADPRRQIAFLKSEAAVAKGLFYPSLLEDLFPALDTTLRTGTRFIDLGSGDGRVVFLAALLGGKATGIEYDRELHRIALQALHQIEDLIPAGRADLRRGDFFKEDLASYDVLFYFTSGTRHEDRLLDKIRREMSPSGILMLAYPYGPLGGFTRVADYGAVQTFRRRDP